MNYALKNDQEVHRLKKQSQELNYNLELELAGIKLPAQSKVLEIGCGAGSLIHFLKDKFDINAYGVDLQPEHIDFCKTHYPKIHFSQHDILTGAFQEKIDHIFMRYVTHHLGVHNFENSLTHIKNSLTPKGKLTIIDVDGLLANIGTPNEELIDYIHKIQQNFVGDLYMGRKIPELLVNNGLTVESTKVQTVVFEGKAREEEIQQWHQRFEFAELTYIKMLGTELDFKRFKSLFFKELSKPHIPYFLNKVITTAQLN